MCRPFHVLDLLSRHLGPINLILEAAIGVGSAALFPLFVAAIRRTNLPDELPDHRSLHLSGILGAW